MNALSAQSFPLPPWIAFPNFSLSHLVSSDAFMQMQIKEFEKWVSQQSAQKLEEYEKAFPIPIIFKAQSLKDFLTIQKENNDFLIPSYSLSNLQKDFRAGKRLKFIFFWGHQPDPSGEITRSCLSQWWQQNFTVGSLSYCCMEQYMMAEKARVFGDFQIEKEIMQTHYPKQIKALGRAIKNFSEEVWNQRKYEIVLTGNYYKFSQNKDLKEWLLSTKNRILVEASPYDRIWGIGLSASEPSNLLCNPLNWKGENLLGFALMEVRAEISRVFAGKQQ